MEEITLNLHKHTNYSFKNASHYDLAQSALDSDVDVFIPTDCGIYVSAQDQYYYRDRKRTLCICGEELYTVSDISGAHVLAIGMEKEIKSDFHSEYEILHQCRVSGALSIAAHPFDQENALMNQKSYAWTNWDQIQFDGIELCNLSSSLKSRGNSQMNLSWFQKNPDSIFLSSCENTILKWDQMLCDGYKKNAYAGSDCMTSGINDRVYEEIEKISFSMLNNHIISEEGLHGDIHHDKPLILNALRNGNLFIGLDGIRKTRGFRFTAEGKNRIANMGETIPLDTGVTLKINIPNEALCRLIHNGKVMKQWENKTSLPIPVFEPGYYRVECYLPYRHELRAWIYSNPIYIVKGGQ